MGQKYTKSLVIATEELGVKAAKALPGIIGVILSSILNKASDLLVGYPKIYGHWL